MSHTLALTWASDRSQAQAAQHHWAEGKEGKEGSANPRQGAKGQWEASQGIPLAAHLEVASSPTDAACTPAPIFAGHATTVPSVETTVGSARGAKLPRAGDGAASSPWHSAGAVASAPGRTEGPAAQTQTFPSQATTAYNPQS